MTEQTTPQRQSRSGPPAQRLGDRLHRVRGVMMIVAGGSRLSLVWSPSSRTSSTSATPEYVLQLDATSWGWIHLLLGLLVLFAGFAVL